VTISDKNFTGIPIADIPVDTEYVRCNFAQPLPVDIGGGVMRGNRLFVGDDTPRTFTRCNMSNCEPPPGSTLTQCNTHIVNNNLLNRTDVVTVDGLEVGRRDFHDHIHYGRYNPDTESYDDIPSPVPVPGDYS
jgi:hypothetical protein